jgi:hypothetical protein
MNALVCRLRCERGQALVEGLLALGLVLFVVAVGAQAFVYAHSRSVAIAAAQDGAHAAASGGPQTGVQRAGAVLQAAGGAGAALHASAEVDGGEVTVTVGGQAPRLFPLSLLLPAIKVSASLPLEQYPTDEQSVSP